MMAAVAHDPAFAKKVGIPQSVGRDFNQADKWTGIRRAPEDRTAEQRQRLAQALRGKG